eukprot:8464480-Pyramimonas_sp.AAC.1
MKVGRQHHKRGGPWQLHETPDGSSRTNGIPRKGTTPQPAAHENGDSGAGIPRIRRKRRRPDRLPSAANAPGAGLIDSFLSQQP